MEEITSNLIVVTFEKGLDEMEGMCKIEEGISFPF